VQGRAPGVAVKVHGWIRSIVRPVTACGLNYEDGRSGANPYDRTRAPTITHDDDRITCRTCRRNIGLPTLAALRAAARKVSP